MSTYYFKDTGSFSYSDSGNWYEDVEFSIPTYNVPNGDYDSVIIGDAISNIRCDIDTSISFGTGQSFVVAAGAAAYVGVNGYPSTITLTQDSTGLSIEAGAELYITSDGAITNNNYITNSGTLTIDNGGLLTNNNYITNLGSLVVASNSILINNTNSFLDLIQGSIFTTSNSSSILALSAGCYVYNKGLFNASGTTNVISGVQFTNFSTGSIINGGTGVFIINNTFVNQGTFNNTGSAINLSQFNNVGGTYINTATTTNNGIFSTSDAGFFSCKASGVFTNNNVFILGSSYTTYFKGKVFPQIPSSAAFGTAILF